MISRIRVIMKETGTSSAGGSLRLMPTAGVLLYGAWIEWVGRRDCLGSRGDGFGVRSGTKGACAAGTKGVRG